MRIYISVSLFMAFVSLPLVCSAADTLKLRYTTSAMADDKGVNLKMPEGVACNDTRFIVADSDNGRLVSYTYEEKNVKGGQEIKLTQIAFPVRVQFDSQGDIFVLDGKSRKVAHLKEDGSFVGMVEPQGLTAPTNYSVKSFKLDTNDNIYLLDIYGERVIKLDPSGKVLNQIAFPKGYGFATDVAVTAGGDIFLLDSVNSIVYVAKKDNPSFVPFTKELSGYMSFASYILTSTSSADIYILDEDGGAVVVIGPEGSFKGRQLSLGWKPSLLYYPTQMCMTKKGDVFIADRNNSRVQIFENVK